MLKKILKNVTKPFSFSLPVKINNKRFLLPIVNGMGWSNLSSHELWMVKLISDILNFKQGVFIDVGANIGQTLLKLRSLSESIPYIGFEINPNSYLILQSIVNLNKLEKCILIPIGLSNNFGIFSIWSHRQDGAFATIEKDLVFDNMKSQSLGVVTRLDDILKTKVFEVAIKEGISCIKVDVEGHELEVLEGAFQSILKYRPLIVIEILNHVLPNKKIALINWCKNNNYSIQIPNFNPSTNSNSCIKTNSFRDGEAYKPEDSNYLLVPVEYENWQLSK